MFLYRSNMADQEQHDSVSHATTFQENCVWALPFLRKKGRSSGLEVDTTSEKTSLFHHSHYFSSTHHYNLVNREGQM